MLTSSPDVSLLSFAYIIMKYRRYIIAIPTMAGTEKTFPAWLRNSLFRNFGDAPSRFQVVEDIPVIDGDGHTPGVADNQSRQHADDGDEEEHHHEHGKSSHEIILI